MSSENWMLKGKRAAIINLGCKVNKYEADAMADKLKSAGMQMVEPEETADVYIVNTCSVTNMAQKKSRQMLRRVRKKNPSAVIVATGCYVNAEHEELLKEDFLDVLVGNNRKKDIVGVITQYLERKQQESGELSGGSHRMEKTDSYVDINCVREYEEMGSISASAMDHRRAYIKIQDGCNQFCSYCIIPYTRGRVRSRDKDSILSEIRQLAEEGVKEFVLTGIHISSYGTDLLEGDLGDLIWAVEQIPAVRRIRLGSLEPRIITPEFLAKIGGSNKLCPHFHLSLQSGCNDTLKRMNRRYTIEEFAEKCRLLREYFDRPAITTDVIVGFPGEGEEEFAATLDHLEKLNLYEIHVFKYSVRSGTAAEKFPDQIPETVKAKRSETLLQLTARQKKEYEASLNDITDEVLIERRLNSDSETVQPINAIAVGVAEQTGEHIDGWNYYTGHTKRYVEVCIASLENLVNEIVEVRIVPGENTAE